MNQDRKILTSIYKSFSNPFPGKKTPEVFRIEEYGYNHNKYYREFLAWNSGPKKVVKSVNHNSEKTHNSYDNKVQEILFATGARRLIFPDNYIIVFFQNRDIKQSLPDSTVVYYYAQHDTTQITVPEAQMEVL